MDDLLLLVGLLLGLLQGVGILVVVHMMPEHYANLRFPDLALALVAGAGTLVAESAVCVELALLLGNLAGSLVDGRERERNGCASGGSAEVLALFSKLQAD